MKGSVGAKSNYGYPTYSTLLKKTAIILHCPIREWGFKCCFGVSSGSVLHRFKMGRIDIMYTYSMSFLTGMSKPIRVKTIP